jgi:hypothetical protein
MDVYSFIEEKRFGSFGCSVWYIKGAIRNAKTKILAHKVPDENVPRQCAFAPGSPGR